MKRSNEATGPASKRHATNVEDFDNNVEGGSSSRKQASNHDDEAVNPNQSMKKKKGRGPCCHEFLEPGTCQFKNCMFDHEFDGSLRQNQDLQQI